MDVQLTYEPSPKQLEAHESEAKFILYGGAVGGGKSVWLVNDALRMALGWNRTKVGIFRWENTSFMKTTYETLEEWVLEVPGLVKHHDKNTRQITLVNDSEIWYGGLKPSASASGDMFTILKSLELAQAYVDEVTDMPEKAYRFLATRANRVKAINPQTGKMEFPPYRIGASCNPELGWVKTEWVDKDLEDHAFISSKVTDNPHRAPGYEDTLRAQFSHMPGWVERYIEGRWDTVVDFEAICPANWLLAAQRRSVDPSMPIAFGVDVATFGDDKTVVTMRRGFALEILLVTGQQGTMDSANQVSILADTWNPEVIYVDTIGVGQGVHDRLAEMGYPVQAFIGGASPNDDRFRNLRAEAYFGVRKLLEEAKLSLPSDENGTLAVNELGQIRYLVSASDRVVQVESKKAIKKRLGHSPDLADSIVYACAGAGFESVFSAIFGE